MREAAAEAAAEAPVAVEMFAVAAGRNRCSVAAEFAELPLLEGSVEQPAVVKSAVTEAEKGLSAVARSSNSPEAAIAVVAQVGQHSLDWRALWPRVFRNRWRKHKRGVLDHRADLVGSPFEWSGLQRNCRTPADMAAWRGIHRADHRS